MESVIAKKLALEIAKPIQNESQVCYILVLCRKLLEFRDQREYDTFRFFCNWALHIDLSYSSAGKLLQQVDSEIPRLLQKNNGAFERDLRAMQVFQLTGFIVAFSVLLMTYGIPAPAAPQWMLSFLQYYMTTISDCPVHYNRKTLKLKHIDKLVIKPTGNPMKFKWELTLKNQPVHEWDIDLVL